MIGFLITIVVLAISLWLISLLPTGVEVDSPVQALIGGAIIGALTGITHLVPSGVRFLGGLVSLGLIPLLTSIIIFGIAAWLVEGFRLRWGVVSAIIGAIALSIINGVLTAILEATGIVPA